ncbi:MAG: hypothetical protein RLZZ142_141 [Verrucomicrobiota bacterium]|jgi:hypothetical protein
MSKRSQFFMLPLSQPRPPGALRVLLLLLLALYTPFGWIGLESGPWDPKRWALLKTLPTLPGLFIQSIAPLSTQDPVVSLCLMGTATFLLLCLLYKIGRQSTTALCLAFLAALAASSWNSWLAFQSFHNL